MDWIVTGSSYSGREWTRRLVALYPDAVTMASNRSIEWYVEDGHRLDYLFVFDTVACEKYGQTAYRLRAEKNVRLVTLARNKEGLTKRGIEHFDEFIGPGRFRERPDWFVRGEWNDMGLSGLWCIQYALNSGATTIHLPGHEGYRGQPSDYDHGEPHPRANALTFGLIEPGMNAIADACKDVQFIFYGDLAYTLHKAPNVTLINTKAAQPEATKAG